MRINKGFWTCCVLACLLLAPLASGGAHAQTIYRCDKDGHITLTDRPCEGAPRAAPADQSRKPVAGGPPVAPEGAWRGVAQLSATLAGKPLALSPQTSQINLVIAPDGSILGGLREQSCELKGQLGDQYDANERAIRFTASACREPNLNLNFSGTLQLAPSGKPSRLAVSGLSGFITGKNPVAASVRADLNQESAPARSQ
jgi:hypothetical protein